jgi:hypothetical protein
MGLSFSTALEAVKDGKRIEREGWNGKGMYLALVDGGYEVFDMPNVMAYQAINHYGLRLLPWIGMKTADDGFVPWLASQTDLLASDWHVLED